MRRREIRMVDLDPAQGSETNRHRPGSVGRVGDLVGTLDETLIDQLDEALRLHLAL